MQATGSQLDVLGKNRLPVTDIEPEVKVEMESSVTRSWWPQGTGAPTEDDATSTGPRGFRVRSTCSPLELTSENCVKCHPNAHHSIKKSTLHPAGHVRLGTACLSFAAPWIYFYYKACQGRARKKAGVEEQDDRLHQLIIILGER